MSGSELYDEAYYAAQCGGAEFVGTPWLKPSLALALKRLELRPGLALLDVGCGRGELLKAAKELGAQAVGCDFAQAAVDTAALLSGCKVLRCDAKTLPFPDQSFDRISFLGVIDHLADEELERTFKEFERLLKPGGFVVVNTCVNVDYWKLRTWGLRKRLSQLLGLREPTPQRAAHDEHMHCNEHGRANLEAFFARIGWEGELEPRPNPKAALGELYDGPLPPAFPIRQPSFMKRLGHALTFWGPWKRFLAREWFCKIKPLAGGKR